MATSQIFKPQAPISFGTPSLGTPAAAPKVNSAITSGLSIGAGGQPLVNGQTPTPYVAPQSTNPTAAGFTPSSAATALTSSLLPTTSGGVSFNPSLASGYSTPTQTPTTPAQGGLSQFVTNSNATPGGGNLTTNANGSPVGYAPSAGYNIDTSGSVPSSALSGGLTSSSLQNSHKSYADYVNALAQAQGYSPSYIAAQQGVYGAQAQGAQLGVNQAAYANQAYGSNQANNGGGLNYGALGGATTDYVAGTIGGQQSANAIKQAENTQQQTQATIALNGQQLARSGNIAAAQTQLQYSPEGQAGSNAITQYNTLQQQYPGANIPEYNQSLTPEQNQQIASYIVSNSPAYKAGFQSTYATPGGGTGIYSKLDVGNGGFQQNQDGSYTLVPAAAAALGAANANVVQTQLGNLSNINSAINASTKTLATTQQFMNQYGLNQSGVSILSQIQNSTNKQLNKAGAVAGLNADLNALRADYAQYLIGRGGSVAGTNDEANKAIPDTISPSQLTTLVQQMQQDGQNTADAVSSQVNQALSGITNNSVPNSGVGSATTGGWGSLGD